jgi:hypothetical protein
MKHILLTGIFLSIALVYGDKFGDAPYAVLLLSVSLILFFILFKLSQGKAIGLSLIFSKKEYSPIDKLISSVLLWLWFFIIGSWIIGVFIGLINSVNPQYVFRNFFGLLVYLFFPIMLIVLPSVNSIITTIYIAGICQICYSLFNCYDLVTNLSSISILHSFSELRGFSSIGTISVFPMFTVGLALQILPKKYFNFTLSPFVNKLSNSLSFTFLCLFTLIAPLFSKGFILTIILFSIMIILFSVIYTIRTGYIRKKSVFLLIVFIGILYIMPSPLYDIFISSYTLQDVSNATRNEQYGYLVSELTILGNGLGSSLKSGYVRDSNMKYGYELTYVNIVHKLGVFSIFLFLSYILTLVIASTRIMRRVYIFESLFVIGLMGYLVVGAGNPLLLSPCAVVLHCVAMYILVKPFLKPLGKNRVAMPAQVLAE